MVDPHGHLANPENRSADFIVKNAVYTEGIFVDIKNLHGGIQFIFHRGNDVGIDDKNGAELASVILHGGSYGVERGLFEIYPYCVPEATDVRGHLSLKKCLRIIETGTLNDIDDLEG